MKLRSVCRRARLRIAATIAFVLLSCGMAGGQSRIQLRPVGFAMDGRSRYCVLVDANAPASVHAIADTLVQCIRRVSGARLPIVHSASCGSRRIALEVGESANASLNVRELGSDGFRIRILKGNIILAAGTERGIRNAVYSFLENYAGCRKLSPTVEFASKRDIILQDDVDDMQVPPVTFRMQDFKDPAYNEWHKLDNRDDWGLFVHTFAVLVPPEKYFEAHPEYFSEIKGNRTPKGQLCLANPDVFRIVVEELRTRMAANPRARFWSVSQNDTYAPCECEACAAVDSVEGSPSGSILAFVNRVADEFPDRIISTLAYQYSRRPPAHIKPRPNVNVMLCSIECNRSRPIPEDPGSASFVEDLEGWCTLTKNIFMWDYVIQFRNLVSPFPNLRVLQPNIQFFVKSGITSIFEQGLSEMHGEFAELRAYLIAKLLWNPCCNADSVMDDFLQCYYGEAAPHIRLYIDSMHDALAASGEDLSIYGYPWPSENGYLSSRMMEKYESFFDEAEDAVKNDPERLFRVRTARLPLQYATLEQAKMLGAGSRGCFIENDDGTRAVRPEIEELLETFVDGCKRAGIPRLWEHGTSPDEYYASTRRFLDESMKIHLAKSRRVELTAPASPKYHNGEASALTDGIRGWNDYHCHWLGFEGEDMEGTIDLGEPRSVSGVGTTFLQDIESWIFMPLAVEFSISEDGRSYRMVGASKNDVPADRYGASIAPFAASFAQTPARYIRVKAVNMKTCPAWHKGAGGKAWIFIDEITVH